MTTLGAPYAASNVKITSIKLYNQKDNKSFEIIKKDEPIYIASDISQKNINNFKNFYVNKAVFKFAETRANKIYVTFEQSAFKDVVIKHAYWTPYEVGKDTKWNGQVRFNPESVLNAINQNPTWDKLGLVPNINRPTEFKSAASDNKIVPVSYTTEFSSATKWQLKISEPNKLAFGGAASVMNEFFWYKRDNNTNIDLFTTKEYASLYPDIEGMNSIRSRILLSPSTSPCVLVDPQKVTPLESLQIGLTNVQVSSSVATMTTSSAHGLSVDDYIYIRGFKDLGGSDTFEVKEVFKVSSVVSTTQFSFAIPQYSTVASTDISKSSFFCVKALNPATEKNMEVLKVTEQAAKRVTTQIVAKRNFEELKAKRASIGIRDISFGKEVYQNSAQMVSKPFLLSGNLDLLSIYAEDYNPNPNEPSIIYQVSVDGGTTFYPIQPVERNYTGVPEIIAFNQNVSNDATIPQVMYLNSGNDAGVPNPINSVVVKIDIKKNRQTNGTPVVYYYKLGTRYR
jgi:hypothetical protein